MADGPPTLNRIRTIREKVENVGRSLGIPEDQALMLVEIDSRQQLTEEIHSLHADELRWHKEAGVMKSLVKKTIAYLIGLWRAEE